MVKFIAYFKGILAGAMLSCIALSAWAEDAPVYDVDHDNYPPFDSVDGGSQGSPALPTATAADQPPAMESDTHPSSTVSERVAKIEQQMSNMQQSNTASKIETLQTEVQLLRNQVEELSHHLEEAGNQQKSMYSDLDNRVKQLSVKSDNESEKNTAKVSDSAVNAVKKSIETPNQPNPAEEQRIYQTAYDLIKAKKYESAIVTLKKMLQKYPTGQFAANAHYWLGELYGLLNKNDQSASEFSLIVKNYPDSPKVSDAELKLGLIYVADFKWDDAKDAFKKVVNRFPGTASARLATEQLKQMRKAGH